MYFQRKIYDNVFSAIGKRKIVVLYGARQVGKTTLVKDIASKIFGSKYLSCDEINVQQALVPDSHQRLRSYLGNHPLIILDEAQNVENIGMTLKILIDQYPDMNILATGSSSFDLANKIGEPLVGRSLEFRMNPLSVHELASAYEADPSFSIVSTLSSRLIYGMYPEVLTAASAHDAQTILNGLVSGNLYKDVLAYRGIKKPSLVVKLLKLLAYQMGNEVSTNELATTLGIDRSTVASYLVLLEQSFLIFMLRPFTKNKRVEISRLQKIYFWDVGIRNAILGAYDDIEFRQDKGALFENFFLAEKLKQHDIRQERVSSYFWRTKQGQEIDYVEERNSNGQRLDAFECKWQKGSTVAPSAWTKLYPTSSFSLVTSQNMMDYL